MKPSRDVDDFAMHVRLLLVGFVFETIAIPVAVEPDLFASSSPDDLFALDNSLSSEGTDIAWADDQLIAGASPDLQWDSQDSDPLLGSTEPSLFDEELASSDPCDGLESSLDFDPLTARDLADSFPGLNELTEPVKDFLNDFQKTPQCSGSSPKAPPEKKIPTSQVPEDSSPDLFIITGLEPGQCPRGYPIPLYCDGFWVGLNVEDCTPCKFQPPLILFFRPSNPAFAASASASYTRL